MLATREPGALDLTKERVLGGSVSVEAGVPDATK